MVTSDTYETKDGYLSIGANHQQQWEKLCRVLGVEELASDPRFANHGARPDNAQELREILVDLFENRSAAELEPLLAAEQVPVSRVRTIPEIVAHPHVAERSILLETVLPGSERPARVVGAGFRFAHDGPQAPGAVARRAHRRGAARARLPGDRDRGAPKGRRGLIAPACLAALVARL